LAFDPSCRATAAECLHILERPGREFDVVGRFIDSFCASGNVRAMFLPRGADENKITLRFTQHPNEVPPRVPEAEFKKLPEEEQRKRATEVEFEKLPEKDWLYVSRRRGEEARASYERRVKDAEARVQEYDDQIRRMQEFLSSPTITSEVRQKIESSLHDEKMRLQDTLKNQKLFPFEDMAQACCVPDYYVIPTKSTSFSASVPPRPFFLPLNKFCSQFGHHEDTRMFDAKMLEFIGQGPWFTVFRYTIPSQKPQNVIIKHTNVNNATFKYLLQEKAMLNYLRSNKFIAGEIPEFSFIPIVTFCDEQNKIENDRFIVYEDAGLPLDSMMKDGWTPGTIEIKQFAKCFMEALDFLRKSNVVHRNIHLKSVVWIHSVPTIKLIALGHARYIGPLPFDRRVHKFLEDFMPASSVALAPHASEDEAFPDIQDHVDSDGCPTVGELEGPQSK
jgi:hypothetical protein